MNIVDTLVGLGGTGLWVASLVTAATGYWWFYRYRTAVTTVAGFGAGLLAGMAVGLGLPVVVGGLGGASLGLFAARNHPRGGTLVVGLATGIGFGPLAAIASTGTAQPGVSLAAGGALGLVLAGLAWRFPRFVAVVGTAALAGVTRLAILAGLGPSVEVLLSGSVVGDVLFTAEGSALVFIGPVLTLTLGTTLQPFLIEYSETVPPLFPASVRRLLSFDDTYGETTAKAVSTCSECGAIGDPGHAACHACGAAAGDEEYGVPDDAVAVDMRCPHCGERPIEETATSRRATGFLIAYQIRTEQYVGCHPCVRRQMWAAAGKTAITGWFSISCILMNPVFVLWNLGRGLVNRGPTLPLAATLDESEIDFEYLHEKVPVDSAAVQRDDVVDADDFTGQAAE